MRVGEEVKKVGEGRLMQQQQDNNNVKKTTTPNGTLGCR